MTDRARRRLSRKPVTSLRGWSAREPSLSTIAPISEVCPPVGERRFQAAPRRRWSSPLLTSDELILVPSLHAGPVTRKRLREIAVRTAELSANGSGAKYIG